MKTFNFIAVLFHYLLIYQEAGPAFTLTIRVIGKKGTSGSIVFNLYDSPAGFPTIQSKATQSKSINAADSSVQVSFVVPDGVYAVSVMHDSNNNYKMDKNIFGVPVEGYCVSNNVRGFLSAPSFAEARIVVDKNSLQVLTLIY